MKPLHTVVAICLLIAVSALPENIEDVKQLPQSEEPVVEAEESAASPRKERCSACANKFNVKSPNDVLAAIQALPPGAEVHTQQSFEGCSSDKGCAGIKVKDGKVIERFGNADAFRAAAAADSSNEFSFHAAGNFGNVFEGGIPGNGPFWWMNQNSPFKNGGGNFEKFSKSSSSSFSTSGSTGAGGVDISANPFLSGGFVAGGGIQGAAKPAGGFESSSFESSSFSSKGNIDLSKNPFLNGGVKLGQGGFQAQGGFGSSQGSSQFGSQSSGFGASAQGGSFGAGSQNSGFGAQGSQGAGYGAASQGSGSNAQGGFSSGSQSGSAFQSSTSGFQNFGAGQSGSTQGGYNSESFSGNKFAGNGFVGSSPRPFTASTPGAGVNLIQNTQKTSEFDYSQSVNIDEASRGSTGISSGGALQQTCSGQAYVCVHKAQCNNGVVNSNGAGILQANSQKQYCDVRTEICCRLETTSLPGAGGLQGSLGVGSATSSGSYQGSSLFATGQTAGQGQSTGQGQSNAFGTSQTNSFGSTGQFNSGTTSFGSNAGSSKGATASGFGAGNFGFSTATPTTNRFNNEVYKSTSQSNFIETDSFSSGSESAGSYRPGAGGSGLKPGIPYLPPVDNTNQPSNVFPSTVVFSTTTPRPTTGRPTYLPPVPSTSAPTYLPPDQHKEGSIYLDVTQTTRAPPTVPINDISTACAAALKCTPVEYCTADGVISTSPVVLTKEQDAFRVPLTDCRDLGSGVIGKCCRDPNYTDPWPTNLLGQWNDTFFGNNGKYVPDNRGSPSVNRQKTVTPFGPNQVTPGFSSSTSKTLTSVIGGGGQISQGGGGSFNLGGRGQYEAGAGGQILVNGQREDAQVTQTTQQFQTANFNRNNQGQAVVIGQGQGAYTGEGQGVRQGQGSFQTNKQYTAGSIQADAVRTQNNYGQVNSGYQGTAIKQGFGTGVSQGVGTGVRQGVGTGVSQGVGTSFSQGVGTGVSQGVGTGFSQGTGTGVSQGVGTGFSQGVGTLIRQGVGTSINQGIASSGSREVSTSTSQGVSTSSQGLGFGVSQGAGTGISQGFGTGVRQGVGSYGISQSGSTIEQEYSEIIYRVFLQQYSANGQCGLINSQKPYGNRNELEVDFSEIPWQAMVLLQTNKSLLCGGVITRPDVVLTSAACVDGLDAKNVLIKGGEWKLGIDDEPLPFQIVQVKHILRHPFYKRGSLQNDAAILVLSENLRLANNILPICLPGPGETLDAFYNGAGECIVTGWGKQVLQAHLSGSILHSVNVSLINPGECQAKLSQDYPHLLEQYDEESCVCGQPTNPTNNICRVDIGSALACTTNGYYVLRGVYSWDSGCQLGNQVAGFYKFDLEWYQWAIGLIESARFAQFSGNAQSGNRFSGQISSGGRGGQFTGGIKQSGGIGFGQNQFSVQTVTGNQRLSGEAVNKGGFQLQGGANFQGGQAQFQAGQTSFQNGQLPIGQNQFTSSVGQFGSSKYQSSGSSSSGAAIQGASPISNTFTATYTEKKIFQSEPKVISYTTKPEIVTFTTKPEYFTYTTKPKVFSYTTKPQVITYETSGSGTNPQYAAPNVSFNPSFTDAVKGHTHNAQCKCLQNGKK